VVITGVEVVTLKFDYPSGGGFRCAGENVTGRVTSLVFVKTDEGVVGIGSAYSHPGLVRLIAEGHLAPMIIGEDPTNTDDLWERMYALTRWYGRKGVAISTLGAIDTALWDIRGKVEGAPIYELLGGTNDRVPAYGSGLGWKDDLDELRDDAKHYLNSGFTTVKMRLGRSRSYDIDAFDAVKDAVGSAGSVIVDGSHRYSLKTAEWLAQYLGEHGAVFFEEPFLPEDIDSYAALRREVEIPLAAGENEFGVQGFRELLRAEAVDVVQPDASRAGGITECARIGSLAHEFGATVATHSWSDAIAIVANAHVVAALPNGISVEIDNTGNPFITDLLVEPLLVEGGLLKVPSGPGLGLVLNQTEVERMRIDTDSLPSGHYSDMAFGNEHLVRTPEYV